MITYLNIQVSYNEHWHVKVEHRYDGSYIAWSASTTVQGTGPTEADACEDLITRAMSQPKHTAEIIQFPKRGRFANGI